MDYGEVDEHYLASFDGARFEQHLREVQIVGEFLGQLICERRVTAEGTQERVLAPP